MKATLVAIVASLLLAGCTTPSPLPDVLALKSPVKADAKVPKTHHHSTLTGYTHREPAAPDAWVEEDTSAPDDKCKTEKGAKDDCPAQ